MKVLKSTVLAFLFSLLFVQVNANAINATPNNSVDPQEKLEKQIAKLVHNSSFWGDIKQDVVFKINFTINTQGEIIVLSTNNGDWDNAAKALLNYKKIEVDPAFYNKIFILPVHLSKENS